MESLVHDAIVIGAGVMGSWAALQLARRNAKVLLLEQFPMPHMQGSSTGETRGLELASSNEEEMPMMLHSRRLWEELQDSTGETLLKWLTPAEFKEELPKVVYPDVTGAISDGSGALWLTPAEFKEELPKVVYPDVTGAISDGSGALLVAAKCLRVIHREFTLLGGTLLDDTAVVEIIPEYSSENCAAVRVRQTSSSGESESVLKANKILVCCGAWSAELVKPFGLDIPITKELAIEGHFQLKDTKSELSRCGIMDFRTNPKPSFHGWCHPPFALPNKVKWLADYLHCVGPILKSPSVLIGLPSGTGFKLCPSLGSILAAMALGKLSQEIESINIKEDTLKAYYPDRFVVLSKEE
ncbi:unnamed protein product [Cyprideis torosa]|uniref:FAD dependent oxidoreductase domain-containing protein n=1 Tax=Cyprideis torosa TaxID=163714 RepID=A0A7R8W3W3_9CRUS|nr:unnamed protein product [Cyprideis torosa]CAG0883460.1 unnamed protein product [Cyprideis torosa]